MAESRNVDDVLAGVEPKVVEVPVNDNEVSDGRAADIGEIAGAKKEPEPEGDELPLAAVDEGVDEYGTEVPKAKTYSEEEVQSMIRDRLKRGHHAKEEARAPYVEPEIAEQGGEDWEKQLGNFIDKRVEEKALREQREAQYARDRQIQNEFEDKFTRGMGRYNDFSDVVAGKPITDSMMLATRSMKDPAAFIYAASKTQAKELERIAKLPDPYMQMAEMGRLDERMRKVRAGSQSPRPLTEVKGDMPNRANGRGSLDDLILKDAKKKLRR